MRNFSLSFFLAVWYLGFLSVKLTLLPPPENGEKFPVLFICEGIGDIYMGLVAVFIIEMPEPS